MFDCRELGYFCKAFQIFKEYGTWKLSKIEILKTCCAKKIKIVSYCKTLSKFIKLQKALMV